MQTQFGIYDVSFSSIVSINNGQTDQIGFLISSLATNRTFFISLIDTEASDRISADNALGVRIDGVSSALTSGLTQEAADRAGAISTLQTAMQTQFGIYDASFSSIVSINNGQTDQIGFLISSLAGNRTFLVSLMDTETNDRISADNALGTRIDGVSEDVATLKEDTAALTTAFGGLGDKVGLLANTLSAFPPPPPEGTPADPATTPEIPSQEQVSLIPDQETSETIAENLDSIKAMDPPWLKTLKDIGYYSMLAKSIYDLLIWSTIPIFFVLSVREGNSVPQQCLAILTKIYQRLQIQTKILAYTKGLPGPLGAHFQDLILKLEFAALFGNLLSKKRTEAIKSLVTIQEARGNPDRLFSSYEEISAWKKMIDSTAEIVLAGELMVKIADQDSDTKVFTKTVFDAYSRWRETSEIRTLIDTLFTAQVRRTHGIKLHSPPVETWSNRHAIQFHIHGQWDTLSTHLKTDLPWVIPPK